MKSSAIPDGGAAPVYIRPSASAALMQGGTEEICATFALTPYSIETDGSESFDNSGTVTIHSTPAAEAVETILGCIDGPGYQGRNFGYLVTASNFGDCSTYTNTNGALGGAANPAQPNGAPIPGLSTPAVTFQKSFDCKAGVDNDVPLTAQVSIAAADPDGYVDIYAGIEATVVEVGCKQADFGSQDGLLHFGDNSIYVAPQSPPDGLTAIAYLDMSGHISSPASSALAQFDSVVHATGQNSAFFTGHLDQTAIPGAPGGTWDVLQTFVSSCPAGHWFAAAQQPTCDTRLTGANAPQTSTLLADAVIAIPGGEWLVADIDTDASGISIISGQSPAYSDPVAVTTAWNPQIWNGTVLLGPPGSVAGLYIDTNMPGQLQVALQQSSGLVFVPLEADASGSWHAGSPRSISSFSGAALAALLAPIQGGCQVLP